MRTTIKFASLALGLALLAPASARADESLDAALATMASATGDDYVAARKAVTSREGAQAALDKALEGQRWLDDTFLKLAMATIARTYVAHPEIIERANHLKG